MKKIIIGIVIGILLSVIGGVIIVKAATLIQASQVLYSNSSSQATNVKGALDELLEKASSSNLNVKAGMISTLVSNYNYEVELGFKPVYVEVLVVRSGAVRSINVYDERLNTTISKIGADTNNTVGLPTATSDAIYNNGFRLNQGYGYDGWYLYYVALSEFPE